MEATIGNGWQRLQACSMSSCTTSLNHKFMGLCETTHERVCGLRSGVGGHLGVITQNDPHLGSHVNYKSIRAYLIGKREGREVLGRSHCKASFSSSYFVSTKALHFL